MPGPELNTTEEAPKTLVSANGEALKAEPKAEEPKPEPKGDEPPVIEHETPAENDTKLVGADGQALTSEVKPERDWTKVKFPIELFENRLAIKRDDREELTKSGIAIPAGAQPRTMTGTVVAVGPGMMKGNGEYIPLQGVPPVKIGDVVVFEKFRQMVEVFVEGRAYHLIRDNDLLGRARGSKVRIASESFVEGVIGTGTGKSEED